MKILRLYITRALLSAIVLTLLVWTFVMVSGNVLKAFDLLARGMPLSVMGKFILYLMPYVGQYTIPLAVLCGTVLVFSRFSAHNEITAMRAGGVSIWQIVAPGIVLAVLASGVCLFLQLRLTPEYDYRATQLRHSQGQKNMLTFVESGRHIELPGYVIYIGQREGRKLREVQVYVLDKQNRLKQDISAHRGEITVNEQKDELTLNLENAIIAEIHREGNETYETSEHTAARTLHFPLEYGKDSGKQLTRDVGHMPVSAILGKLAIASRQGESTSELFFELHKRIAMAFSPLSFLFVAIPFGICTRRSETSVGILVSIVLALGFYIFLALADSLQDQARYQPSVIVWFPNILYQLGGLFAIYHMSRK